MSIAGHSPGNKAAGITLRRCQPRTWFPGQLDCSIPESIRIAQRCKCCWAGFLHHFTVTAWSDKVIILSPNLRGQTKKHVFTIGNSSRSYYLRGIVTMTIICWKKLVSKGGKVHRRQLGNPGSLRPSLKKNHGEFGHVGHDTSSGTNETTSEESSRKTINNCCLTTAYCLGLVLVSLKEKDIGRLRHRGMSNGNMKDSSMLVPLFHAPEIHKKQNKSFWGNITADETSSSMYQQCKDVCLRCHL